MLNKHKLSDGLNGFFGHKSLISHTFL